MHRHIRDLLARQGWDDWPTDRQLNAMFASRARTAAGRRLRFVSRADAGQDGAAAYESQINASGEIPVRPGSWHDLFNALMWILYPATKAALNVVHVRELGVEPRRRSARRDAVTLLDECGVLLPVADERLTRLHAGHRWRELFVARRDAWGTLIEPMIIGHGLYEQCLRPYVGLTAKALHLPVPATFFARSRESRFRELDRMLAASVLADQRVLGTDELLPLPVLGVPGWCDANLDPAFYANAAYFRPKPPAR